MHKNEERYRALSTHAPTYSEPVTERITSSESIPFEYIDAAIEGGAVP